MPAVPSWSTEIPSRLRLATMTRVSSLSRTPLRRDVPSASPATTSARFVMLLEPGGRTDARNGRLTGMTASGSEGFVMCSGIEFRVEASEKAYWSVYCKTSALGWLGSSLRAPSAAATLTFNERRICAASGDGVGTGEPHSPENRIRLYRLVKGQTRGRPNGKFQRTVTLRSSVKVRRLSRG